MRAFLSAWLTRVTILLLAALLTAAQATVFVKPALAPQRSSIAREDRSHSVIEHGPSWTYGVPTARFTLIEYADLECPYCASSFAQLRQWIDRHADVNWQWRHLPLAMHEPQAMLSARKVECIGESEGNGAFWNAVAQHYEYVRRGTRLPTHSADHDFQGVEACLRSMRPDRVIRTHMAEAAALHINATPTLIIQDRKSGKQILFQGAPSAEALVSAIDALLAV